MARSRNGEYLVVGVEGLTLVKVDRQRDGRDASECRRAPTCVRRLLPWKLTRLLPEGCAESAQGDLRVRVLQTTAADMRADVLKL